MNDVLDQRLAPERDEVLLRHAGECTSCRRILDGQAVLFAGLNRLDTPFPANGFAADVLVRAQRGANKKWLGIAAGLVSIAAVLLVAVLIGLLRQDPARPTVVQKETAPAPQNIEVARNSLPSTVARPPTLANVAKSPSMEPQKPGHDYAEYREAINSLTARLPSAVERIDEVQQSTPAIRPLRASFSMAIGTLQKTIPNRGQKREQRHPRPDSGYLGQPPEVVV